MRFFTLFTLLFFFSCQSPGSGEKEALAQETIAKIDIHAHYTADKEYLLPLLDAFNMRALLVDVVRIDSLKTERYWEDIKDQQERHPDHFFLCTGFNAYGIDDPDFASKIIQQLDREIAAGARMVKVWKNIGMVDKDQEGNFIQIDDPRFQPIWDFLIEKNIPVLAHIAEPIQAWRPLEEGNPHYNYYSRNPQYHAYQHPEIPRWETIIGARDNWLANNPQLIVVGAHMGSMSHDVDLIAQHLDQYPNFYVEPAARFGDITGQDSEKVRAFFLKYQDRILYGTDFSSHSDDSPEAGDNTRKMMELHWSYFSGADSLYFDSPMISFPVNTHSLALPEPVLKKLYSENAAKILNL